MAEQQIAPIQLVQGVLTLSAPLWPSMNTFRVGQNELLVKQLNSWLVAASPTVSYLTGEASSGKTHLAQAILAQQSQSGFSCGFISGKDSSGLNPQRLQGMEQLSLVCIDDADRLLTQSVWLTKLQQLVVLMRDTGGCVLLVQREIQPYSGLDGLFFTLLPLATDDEKRLLLIERAEQRGLKLSKELINWLMKSYSTDLDQLMHVLSYLDHGSMTLKHPITLPFAKKLLLQS
jgi:DnaA family protein